MGVTVIGSPNRPFPDTFLPPVIERRKTWEDNWQYDPELILAAGAVHASSSAVSMCTIQRRYGTVKQPWEVDFSSVDSNDLGSNWVRVSIMGEQGPLIQFVGRIENQARELQGKDNEPSGLQTWVAYGGLKILSKLTISESVFLDSFGFPSKVGWVPAMNVRGSNRLEGNRTSFLDPDKDAVGRGVYGYGGTDVWSHFDYCKYLIEYFVQQFDTDGTTPIGPTWTIGGQVDILKTMKTSIDFAQAGSVMQMFRELIPVQYGVDFHVQPTENGFQIIVFALAADEGTAVGATMPKNPDLVEVHKSNMLTLTDVSIVESDDRRVDRIEVVGKRIVVCGTLRGGMEPYGVGSAPKTLQDTGDHTLIPKWSQAPDPPVTPPVDIESEYIAADGQKARADALPVGDEKNLANDPKTWDVIRERDRYRDVFQRYGAPDDWDKNQWSVGCADDGTPGNGTVKGSSPPEPLYPFQVSYRDTLSQIPLKEGFDYLTDPPTDYNESGQFDSDHKHPMAWLYLENPLDGSGPRYVACHQVGIHVHVPRGDWGVILDAGPNHRLAENRWTTAQLETTAKGPDVLDWFDYRSLVATIAIESDHRLKLAYSVPADLASDDGSVMTIHDDQAELWVALPLTVVDLTIAGELASLPKTDGLTILRNDVDRLALVLAGAVTKYINQRLRASLTFRGHMPWGTLVGNILTVIQQGDVIHRIGAPITSVEWKMSPPMTVIRTGYA
jgi:hypothetical protein